MGKITNNNVSKVTKKGRITMNSILPFFYIII